MRFLRRSHSNRFRPGAATSPGPLASLPAPLADLAERLRHVLSDPANADHIGPLIAHGLGPAIWFEWAADTPFRRHFDSWQDAGFSLLPLNAHSPVPHVRGLSDAVLGADLPLGPLGWDLDQQAAVVDGLATEFKSELAALGRPDPDQPGAYRHGNGQFEAVDAELLYGMIRRHRPRRLVEVKSGQATRVAAMALARNGSEGDEALHLTLDEAGLDPLRDSPHLPQPVPGGFRSDAAAEAVAALKSGDILLADTSHMLALGSDVDWLLFEVLPGLAPGVLVQFHNIFLPRRYPAQWVRQEHVFWNEQYALMAFLMFNTAYRAIVASAYLHGARSPSLARLSEAYDPASSDPGSLWIVRTAEPA